VVIVLATSQASAVQEEGTYPTKNFLTVALLSRGG